MQIALPILGPLLKVRRCMLTFVCTALAFLAWNQRSYYIETHGERVPSEWIDGCG